MNKYVIFILSHGRAESVFTLKSLRKCGYTGEVVFVCDNEDESVGEYLKKFKKVEVFDKLAISKTFDEADNFDDRRSIVYARNACFEIAEKLGYEYFIQMDDDYTGFDYRVYSTEKQKPTRVKSLDKVFELLLKFYKSTPFVSLAMAQGGDFIGGKKNQMARKPTIYRKCMNSFICSTKRPFQFIGRINEDVNTYTKQQSKGLLMGTIPLVSLTQKTTQKTAGGMTDIYLNNGTYVKSFYTVMFSPSSCYIRPMGDTRLRLHHAIKWNHTVPKIVSESLKKNT